MNTNHLQSIKQANKQTINSLHDSIKQASITIAEMRRWIKADKARLAKKVDQQRSVKADISSAKVARPAGSRRKHNKSDPRYAAWYTAQHSARNADTSVKVQLDNIPVPVACGC